jgi:hypothetical protein
LGARFGLVIAGLGDGDAFGLPPPPNSISKSDCASAAELDTTLTPASTATSHPLRPRQNSIRTTPPHACTQSTWHPQNFSAEENCARMACRRQKIAERRKRKARNGAFFWCVAGDELFQNRTSGR